jgi:2-haloacid dehalogenase
MATEALTNVRAVTFDMYGTLLDLEASFGEGLGRFLRAAGSDRDVSDVVQLWEATYLRESMVDSMLGRGRTLFERIRRNSLSRILAKLGVAHTAAEIEDLLTTGARFTLYPDVQEGLLSLKGAVALAVLSNGDLGSLERTVSSLVIPVEHIVSAEQAGVYKPHSVVYRTAAEHLNLPPSRILHVAAHPWDIRGAKAFGMLGAYVNRENVPFGYSTLQADLEISNLTGLAAHLRQLSTT